MENKKGGNKKWETYLLYRRYLATGNLPEADSKKLIDGLAVVINDCYRDRFEGDKIFLHTNQFREGYPKNNKGFI